MTYYLSTNGTFTAKKYHTDKDCTMLNQSTGVREADESEITQRDMDPCCYCAGGRREYESASPQARDCPFCGTEVYRLPTHLAQECGEAPRDPERREVSHD